MSTDDPRRDAVLLWLADHAVPAITEAAATLARMVGATRRFSVVEQALLDAARDALTDPAATPGPIGKIVAGDASLDDPVLQLLRIVASAVDRLRGDTAFLEGVGAEVCHALPRGTLNRYVPAEPAGCWAVNLALLARESSTAAAPPPPGQASRALFRSDLEPDEIAAQLVEGASAAWMGAYGRLLWLEPELARGLAALAHLSRNARTRDAWLLVAPPEYCTRTQLARTLGLARAGSDLQIRALADAGW